MTPARCTLVVLDASDLERAAESPALACLWADGWRPVAAERVERPDGRHGLAVVLGPPATDARPVTRRWLVGLVVGAVVLHHAVALAIAWALSGR